MLHAILSRMIPCSLTHLSLPGHPRVLRPQSGFTCSKWLTFGNNSVTFLIKSDMFSFDELRGANGYHKHLDRRLGKVNKRIQ